VPATVSLLDSRTGGVRRTGDRLGDRMFRAVALGAGLLVLLILGLIAYFTIAKAWPAFKEAGFSFLFSDTWDQNTNQFGGLALIYGTILTSVIALVFAVPLSLGIALFTTEVAPKRMRTLVTYVIDLLAAIPSVVYGYWAFVVFRTSAEGLYTSIANAFDGIPGLNSVFGNPAQGASFMTAGLILAVMVTPIITSLSRETLMTVAQDDKNAALAMGATRWEMLRISVLPRVRSGLIGAVMLGLGRAMGETIAVALFIGGTTQVTSNVFAPGRTMASIVANNFGEATGVDRSALIGLGVVLFAITIVVNMLARWIAGRSSDAMRGAR
jgi:phosphate transport system permease protein